MGQRGRTMRVVINQSTTLGPRTGIGHYVAELIRCLEPLTDEPIDIFPQGWLRRAKETVAHVRSSLAARANRPPLRLVMPTRWAAARGRALNELRRHARTAL